MICDKFLVNLVSMSRYSCRQKFTHTADNSIFKIKYVFIEKHIFSLFFLFFILKTVEKSVFYCVRADYYKV